jgi:hypothetical protein
MRAVGHQQVLSRAALYCSFPLVTSTASPQPGRPPPAFCDALRPLPLCPGMSMHPGAMSHHATSQGDSYTRNLVYGVGHDKPGKSGGLW